MSRESGKGPGALADPAPAEVYLLPGQARVAISPTRFTTILGSCVAVCLFDRRLGVGGLNHFLLPGAPERMVDDRLRWGEPAIEWLVASARESGARAGALEAKVFGGAHVAQMLAAPRDRIGDRNAATALGALERLGIPVVARAVGGVFGRKLVFESHTGSAFVRELKGDA